MSTSEGARTLRVSWGTSRPATEDRKWLAGPSQGWPLPTPTSPRRGGTESGSSEGIGATDALPEFRAITLLLSVRVVRGLVGGIASAVSLRG